MVLYSVVSIVIEMRCVAFKICIAVTLVVVTKSHAEKGDNMCSKEHTDGACPEGYVCCTCVCHEGDVAAGLFDCQCDDKGKPLPNSAQPSCCGGTKGFDLWCISKNTAAASNPKCTADGPGGVPTPSQDFYPYLDPSDLSAYRCVKDRCAGGFCDNKGLPGGTGC